MKTFDVCFYYKGAPAVDGQFEIEADSLDDAKMLLTGMVSDSDARIPGNWESRTVKERIPTWSHNPCF